MAVREGFFETSSRNLNNNGLIPLNSVLASDLTSSDSRRRLRRFAPVFGFCQRDVTHSVTRGRPSPLQIEPTTPVTSAAASTGRELVQRAAGMSRRKRSESGNPSDRRSVPRSLRRLKDSREPG